MYGVALALRDHCWSCLMPFQAEPARAGLSGIVAPGMGDIPKIRKMGKLEISMVSPDKAGASTAALVSDFTVCETHQAGKGL